MSVEVLGMPGEMNGHGDSIEAFRNAHESNTNALLNVAEKKPKNAPRPAYDPRHADNQWPVMVYHPAKGELTVGTNLKGVDPNLRRQVEANNKTALKAAVDAGYRQEPYLKPQVAVLDPALEKAALMARNQELEGKIVAQADRIDKLTELVEKLVAGQKG